MNSDAVGLRGWCPECSATLVLYKDLTGYEDTEGHSYRDWVCSDDRCSWNGMLGDELRLPETLTEAELLRGYRNAGSHSSVAIVAMIQGHLANIIAAADEVVRCANATNVNGLEHALRAYRDLGWSCPTDKEGT